MGDYSTSALFLSELVGTMLLLLLGVGVSANTTLKRSFGHGHDWLLIAIGWGFGVFVGASVSWRSGANLNPAVTLQQAFTGSLPWRLVPVYFAAQLIGAMLGAVLAYLAYKKQFDTHDDPANTGGIFFTSAAVRAPGWNVITEAIGTFVLLLWIHESSPFQFGVGDASPQFGNSALGYAAIAFTIIAIGASLGGPTGYAINPFRDLGPRIVYTFLPIKGKGSSQWSYSWIPIAGPLLGVVAALTFYVAAGNAVALS